MAAAGPMPHFRRTTHRIHLRLCRTVPFECDQLRRASHALDHRIASFGVAEGDLDRHRATVEGLGNNDVVLVLRDSVGEGVDAVRFRPRAVL
ncbi:hypothetical protein C5C66_09850 [Rathayibacter toxicus]|uniref:Uncharacterized protein n=1 Tax=Rathayibacter toxicus TaxID=145458 RepID=A0A0C5BGC8_9MICO|nr:hypothetical protein TI83_09985 [Rathayibacter toxicus]ALS57562.1 hypothetical protein APU90_07080 [Rathayibacter toxicus]KKM44920.1 hypothetical protein VT73_07245 [Rathayibacter toxicus]PPG20770.1 hypothetical protein C5D15_09845 [Rathayibacter toxicus]PPG45873.1 hypothetical protein C5D16_09810 [Rathayibacter toxicus]